MQFVRLKVELRPELASMNWLLAGVSEFDTSYISNAFVSNYFGARKVMLK